MVEMLWTRVYKYGVELWGQPEKVDGRAAWQPVKALLRGCTGRGVWKPFDACRGGGGRAQQALQRLEEYEKAAAPALAQCDPEMAHFYAQLLRIPLREECSLLRLCQVAFNAGQLAGSGGLKRLATGCADWQRLYEELDLDSPQARADYSGAFQASAECVSAIGRFLDAGSGPP